MTVDLSSNEPYGFRKSIYRNCRVPTRKFKDSHPHIHFTISDR